MCLRRVIATTAILLSSLIPGRAFAIDGPSFDCKLGLRQTLAVLLCTSPEAAAADWDYNRAYWAAYSDDREQITFNESVNRRCALPPLETQQQRNGRVFLEQFSRALGAPVQLPSSFGITQQHVRCVVAAFREEVKKLRDRLRGDALRESNLSPEEHISIQDALIRKGFLQNHAKRYGANADGQFGPNTRSAIKGFQSSIGSEATGFLSNDQISNFLESPEERQRRAAELAAREKERQEASAARQLAEEEAKKAAADREKARLAAQEKAKQEAAEAERKKLEEEAQRATEWRRKIDEAQVKGSEYAKLNDTKWSLAEKMNPMTDDVEYTVSSMQTNGTGAIAEVSGFCLKDRVVFDAALHSSEDKVPLGFANSSAGGIVGNKRVNDAKVFAFNFPLDKWRNQLTVSRQSFGQEDPESADTTWRVLAEIETSRGTLYIKIPMLDEKIQKLVAACKRRH